MKSQDFLFYSIAVLAIALFVLSPSVIDSAYSQMLPIFDGFHVLLDSADLLVSSKLNGVGY